MKKIGNLLIVLAVINTLVLWVLSKPDPAAVWSSPFRALGQIAGLLAALFVCAEFLLATRMRVLERLFGGLDKVYRTHAITGALAFLFMLNHPVLLAINVLPSVPAAVRYFYPSLQNLPYAYGILGLYLMIMLLLLTLFLKLPYHIWKRTHILMVFPQLFILAHVTFISSDVSEYLPLRYWILGLCALSLVAYVYRRFFYPYLGHCHNYRISAVRQLGDITELTLEPQGKPLEFTPGQFVFLSLDDKTIGTEQHPFSIVSAPTDAFLKLSIKHSGDYTKRLVLAKAGIRAKIYGPYGMFGEKSVVRNKDEVWIAGGIGITPFMSLLRYYATKSPQKNIWLFYSTRKQQDAAYVEEISRLAKIQPHIRFFHQATDRGEKLTANLVAKTAGGIADKQFFLCGPVGMVEDLWEQFVSLGVKPRNLIYEEFNFLP